MFKFYFDKNHFAVKIKKNNSPLGYKYYSVDFSKHFKFYKYQYKGGLSLGLGFLHFKINLNSL